MEKYKIENVRGGTFSQVVLNEEYIKTIKDQIKHARDACIKCGKNGHFISDCKRINSNKDVDKLKSTKKRKLNEST
jgi:hypothetical protein